MAANQQNHLFSNKSKLMKKKDIDLTFNPHQQKSIYHQFSTMYNSIVKYTPANMSTQLIRDGHVSMRNYAGSTAFPIPIETSDSNILKCNMNTKDIVPTVSCYPDAVILEIRDAFNMNNPEKFIEHDNSDIDGILAKLKSHIGGTEDAYLTVFSKEKEMVYRHLYFAPTKHILDFAGPFSTDREHKGTTYNQYCTVMRQLEDKYSNYIDIFYCITQEQRKTEKYIHAHHNNFSIEYNDKYSHLFKLEYEKITQDDHAMFAIYKTFQHIYLIILLQYFIKQDHIEHISIRLSYSMHSQAIYINKQDTGRYIFYNSNNRSNGNSDCQNEQYPINASIDNDVRALLQLTYPDLRVYTHGKHQYELPLCAVFVHEFIKSMLDPSKTLNEKFYNLHWSTNKDAIIRSKQFDDLNRLIPSLQIKYNTFQRLDNDDDDTDAEKRLIEKSQYVQRNELKKFTTYYVICRNQGMNGFYSFDYKNATTESLHFFLRDKTYRIDKDDYARIFKHRAHDMFLPSASANAIVDDQDLIPGLQYHVQSPDVLASQYTPILGVHEKLMFVRHLGDGVKHFSRDSNTVFVDKDAIIRRAASALPKNTTRKASSSSSASASASASASSSASASASASSSSRKKKQKTK